MKLIIDTKSYNLNKNEEYCEFKINPSIDCIEYGYTVDGEEGYKSIPYKQPAVDSPILGCMNFYINIYGVRNDQGHYSKTQLTTISKILGGTTLFCMLFILCILISAKRKYKKLRKAVK